MNFLCPSCRTPLPASSANQSVGCARCGVVVDLTGVDTAPGQARLWPQIDLATETLGGFKLERTLGAGGMGAVYAAVGPDGAAVAVKVLAPLLAAEPGLRERFRREAHALRALTHRGVVRILAEGEERGFCWYAMEKIDGADLRDVLKRGRMAVANVEALARALLDALAAVHDAGLVHRDIKPGNILLAGDGPKLCDFGIARFDGQSTLTESAAILGSLRYMAPEQRWGKSGPLSDLYGVGVVLHEALWGGVPGEVAAGGDVPAWLSAFVMRLVSARAEDRPGSARAAVKLLEALKGRRRRQLVGAGAIVCLALIAGGGAWWPSPGPRPLPAGRIAAIASAPDAGEGRLALAAEPDAGAAVVDERTLRTLLGMSPAELTDLPDDEKRRLLQGLALPPRDFAQSSTVELNQGLREVVTRLKGTGAAPPNTSPSKPTSKKPPTKRPADEVSPEPVRTKAAKGKKPSKIDG